MTRGMARPPRDGAACADNSESFRAARRDRLRSTAMAELCGEGFDLGASKFQSAGAIDGGGGVF